MGKLIIDGNEVYEIDEECMKKKEAEKKKRTAPEKGGQRYGHKKESCLQDSPPAAGRFSDIIPLGRSATLPGGLFVL